MKIRIKLVFGYLSILIIVGLVGLLGIQTARQSAKEFDLVSRETLPEIEALENMQYGTLRVVSSINEFAFIASEERQAKGNAELASEGKENENVLVEYGKGVYELSLTRYKKLVNQSKESKDKLLLKKIETAGRELQKTGDELLHLFQTGEFGSKTLAKKEEFENAEQNLLDAIVEAIEHEKEDFNASSKKVARNIRLTVTRVTSMTLLALLVAIVVGIYTSRTITIPLMQLRDAAVRIGKGQLDSTVQVKSKDEIGFLAEYFNHMRISLKNRLLELHEAHERALRDERLGIVGRMASSIIHDFRGPMQIIQGSAELLSMAAIPEEKRQRQTRVIIQQVERMANMTQELLDFAKGESRTRKTILAIDDLVTELNLQADEFCRDSLVKFRADLNKPFQLWADKEKLLRVLANLVKNAKEAMPAGGEIKVAAFLDGMEGVIQVSDNGPGLPPELAGRLFEPFASFGKKGGTGLGLAMAKKIVEEHGGTLQCESEQGLGTTFTIRVPAGERVVLATANNVDTDKVVI